MAALHPAFGLDEDWNLNSIENKFPNIIASSLRAGWGLKQGELLLPCPASDCIQPSGWMRIETMITSATFTSSILHPAFGLDEDWNIGFYLLAPVLHIASSLRAGWGLKLHILVFSFYLLYCIQPSGWMRIETLVTNSSYSLVAIASSLRAGWGLKPIGNGILKIFVPLHPAFGLDEDWNYI